VNTICLFSTQRPATAGLFATIQNNALKSWSILGCPIVLFGAECNTDCLPHIPAYLTVTDTVDRNEKGIPYIRSMFHNVQERVEADLYCYVNADIILTGDFAQALDAFPAAASKLLIAAGRRWDIGVTRDIPLTEMDNVAVFAKTMRKFADDTGKLHSPDGIDYFIFPAGMTWPDIPNLVVGHPAWDNWMLWDVYERRGMLVDMTHDIRVYHQNHPCIYEDTFTIKNRELAGKHLRTMKHATHFYCNGRLCSAKEFTAKERMRT
jgi:hypothetical protein